MNNRTIAKVQSVMNGEWFSPDMYVVFQGRGGNKATSQWDFVLQQVKDTPSLFKVVYEDELVDESESPMPHADELAGMDMKDLMDLAKLKKVQYRGIGKTALIEKLTAVLT